MITKGQLYNSHQFAAVPTKCSTDVPMACSARQLSKRKKRESSRKHTRSGAGAQNAAAWQRGQRMSIQTLPADELGPVHFDRPSGANQTPSGSEWP